MKSPMARWDAARGKWRIRAIRGGKWFRERGQKGVSMLPHLFTLANLACGVYSIIQTFAGNYHLAALLVGASLLADGLDGRVARLVRADGEFGKELDSLADVVSFGTAPAILAYFTVLERLGPYGLAVTVIFPICGALRLARFNIIKTAGFFIGLPITAAGTLLAALIYVYHGTPAAEASLVLPLFMLCLAYLMISTIPYPDFKKARGYQFRFLEWAGPVVLVIFVLARAPRNIVYLPLVTYAFLGPWLYLVRRVGGRGRPMKEAGNQ